MDHIVTSLTTLNDKYLQQQKEIIAKYFKHPAIAEFLSTLKVYTFMVD